MTPIPEPAAATTGAIGHPAEAPTTVLALPPRPAPTATVRWFPPLLALAAVALLPVAAATTDLTALDGWGLAKVLGPAAWAALACAVAACVTELWSARPRVPVLGVATAVLILCSHGMPSVVEPAARFTTAWLLAGFTDALAGDGVPPLQVDARFYWPAFFAQWAFFRDAGGATQLDGVLRWFPPVIVGVWTVGVYALGRSMLGGRRAPWAAAWLFLGLNWIEQDYFSPQATAIVLMLTPLVFALGPLATRRTRASAHPGVPVLRRWWTAARTPPSRPTLPPRQLLLVYFCAALCLVALAPTHQLTPFAIAGQLAVLALAGRFRGRGLVLVAVVAVAVYLLIAGRGFWMHQIALLTGGDDPGALEAGVADRLQGDTGQVAVRYLRIVVPVLVWLLAIAGAWVYWRRRRDVVPIALAAVPIAMAVQSYGGEILLRIVLFGLPVLAVLGAEVLRALALSGRSRSVRRGRAVRYGLAAGMALLFGLLVLIRGGNEAYMIVHPHQVDLVRRTFAQTPPGLEVLPLTNVGPYGLAGIGTHERNGRLSECVQETDDPVRCVEAEDPDVLFVFSSVEAQGVHLHEKPPGWSAAVVQELVASGRYVVADQQGPDLVLRRPDRSAPPR